MRGPYNPRYCACPLKGPLRLTFAPGMRVMNSIESAAGAALIPGVMSVVSLRSAVPTTAISGS